jgi:flagellar biosynthetic protein FliQ
MTPEMVLYLGRRALETALMLAGPPLAVALIMGVSTAVLQAITSVRDMTLAMVLKIAGVGVAVLLFGGWMLEVILAFTLEVFQHIQSLNR